MKTELHYYDIYPKVLPSHAVSTVHIKTLGGYGRFADGATYGIMVIPMNETNLNITEKRYQIVSANVCGNELSFSFAFGDEEQYCIRILDDEKKELAALHVYVLDEDLYQLTPYRGDLHVHTYHSDGMESPGFAAAFYRKNGYDFMAITDHGQYAPSLEAINAYQDVSIDLKLFPGEEVHPPHNNSHIINFGGEFSLNEIFQKQPERYYAEVKAIEEELDVPSEINGAEYASCVWAYKKIREGNGLSVMPHPHWVQSNAYHVREKMLWYLFENKPFDAFELIGGQTLAENLMQVAAYQEARARGFSFPVVGSSDSHGVINAEWFDVAKTVVLAKSNEKSDIIDAIRKNRSVALEQYLTEPQPRIFGAYRIVSYVLFLIEEYFPLHDDLCYEEGRLMKDYICGVEGARASLNAVYGRTRMLINKYFGR